MSSASSKREACLEPIVKDGICWHLAPEAKELFHPDDLHLHERLQNGEAEIVKQGPHRTVYRVRLPQGIVYYKQCKLLGIRGYLRQCLRPPKAKLEFDGARALRNRGIATFEPLAWGTQAGRTIGESYLVTKALVATVPLTDFFETNRYPLTPSERYGLTAALGQFLAQLHEAGILHPDLHTGNLLVERQDERSTRFHVIDLHAIQPGKPASWPAARENLVLLNRWMQLRTTRADRWRFLNAYLAARPELGIALPDAARQLEAATEESNYRFWHGRRKRCQGNNRQFRKLRSSKAIGHAVRDANEPFVQSLLADPDAPFGQPNVKFLKQSPSSTVIELEIPTADGPRAMIYKRMRRNRWYDRLTPWFYTPPLLRSWMLGDTLLGRVLPTPRPIAILHRRAGVCFGDGYLLCEKVEKAEELHAFAQNLAQQPHFHQAKRTLLHQLARLLRQFHQRFLAHRDLKAANILVTPSTAEEPPFDFSFWLIDLVGVRSTRPGYWRRVRNLTRLNASFLATLNVTRTDRLRFLRDYLSWSSFKEVEWKRWWRDVEQATQRKLARNTRRGRPLS